MKFSLITFLVASLAMELCAGTAIDSLLGKCFKLDKEVTQNYLIENNVIPEEKVHLLDMYMEHLIVCFEKDNLVIEEWTGQYSVPYKVKIESSTRVVLSSQDANGDWRETRIELVKDGYWQETDAFPGYREKFLVQPVAGGDATRWRE